MNKVYLLLRHNKQSGPFTFDELMQQRLQPADLIWVEGQSTHWVQASEFKENVKGDKVKQRSQVSPEQNDTTIVKDTAPAPRQKERVYVRRPSPAAELERKAVELRKQSLDAAAHAAVTPEVETRIVKPRMDNTAPDIAFTYRTSRNTITPHQLLVAALISAFAIAVVYGNWSPIQTRDAVTASAAVPYVSAEWVVAQPVSETLSEPALKDSLSNMLATPAAAELPKPVNRQPATPVAVIAETPEVEAVVIKKDSIKEPVKKEVVETVPPVEKPVQVPIAKKEDPEPVEKTTVTEAPEKKKKLGKVLADIFKKKKKDDEKDNDQ